MVVTLVALQQAARQLLTHIAHLTVHHHQGALLHLLARLKGGYLPVSVLHAVLERVHGHSRVVAARQHHSCLEHDFLQVLHQNVEADVVRQLEHQRV